MSKTGPIIIIDDDPDDQEMIQRVLKRMNLDNEIKRFYDGTDALKYFQDTQERPFLTLCDINMPLMNGFELRKTITSDANLKSKTYPFIYLTTTNNPDHVRKAYQLEAEGFFVKGQSYDELKETLANIIEYWKYCRLSEI